MNPLTANRFIIDSLARWTRGWFDGSTHEISAENPDITTAFPECRVEFNHYTEQPSRRPDGETTNRELPLIHWQQGSPANENVGYLPDGGLHRDTYRETQLWNVWIQSPKNASDRALHLETQKVVDLFATITRWPSALEELSQKGLHNFQLERPPQSLPTTNQSSWLAVVSFEIHLSANPL